MAWQRIGRVLDGPGSVGWAKSHAMMPVPIVRSETRLDVFFSSRDDCGRARIGTVAVDPRTWRAGRISLALDLGEPGTFDDAGCHPSWVVERGGREYLFYTGWMLGVSVPFYFYVGLARVEADGRLARESHAPILERNAVDPLLTASPCVLQDEGHWRMWYVSGVRWTIENRQPKHYYHIRYAESADGIAWKRDGRVCIDFASPGEFAIARPSVIRDADRYRMWYTFRGERYRLGYAESRDGLVWERRDHESGLELSADGWDSEMVTYPYVFDLNGDRYMLYNGNGYGKTGFGVAVWR